MRMETETLALHGTQPERCSGWDRQRINEIDWLQKEKVEAFTKALLSGLNSFDVIHSGQHYNW